jgi:hypothetical protein
MLSGANTFGISDIPEDETDASLAGDHNVTMTLVENHWMEFLRTPSHMEI